MKLSFVKKILIKEPVLTVAAILAVISMFFVTPNRQYIEYIDFRTLAILFSLMTVMAGLKCHGIFDKIARAMLRLTRNTFQLLCTLTGMCFFGSMFITNDVALLTFVPITFVILAGLEKDIYKSLAVPVVCMETIAANLGSMLTPIGNPQNLYLYGISGMSISDFLLLMLPYTLFSLILLIIWALILSKKKGNICTDHMYTKRDNLTDDKEQTETTHISIVVMYIILFILCLLAVIRILPYGIAFAAVLICTLAADRRTLAKVDYSLLFTFAAFFIFVGNLGRIRVFSSWLQDILADREVLTAVLTSQVTSNVPAALLLSGFTMQTDALIIGTNIGGLGTLIASMASLISYRKIATELPDSKGKYFLYFTISNIIFLILLLALYNGHFFELSLQ